MQIFVLVYQIYSLMKLSSASSSTNTDIHALFQVVVVVLHAAKVCLIKIIYATACLWVFFFAQKLIQRHHIGYVCLYYVFMDYLNHAKCVCAQHTHTVCVCVLCCLHMPSRLYDKHNHTHIATVIVARG